jgi:hypothetical protein
MISYTMPGHMGSYDRHITVYTFFKVYDGHNTVIYIFQKVYTVIIASVQVLRSLSRYMMIYDRHMTVFDGK